jgi:rhodanese-related sulfurtransferase
MFARLMGLKTISPRRLLRLIQSHSAIAIDVNPRRSWVSTRVPGALNLDPVSYGEKDLPADKNAVVVFYCSNFMCRKAPNAARRAEHMGFANVHVMSAGIKGWLDAGLPVESGESEDVPATSADSLG